MLTEAMAVLQQQPNSPMRNCSKFDILFSYILNSNK